jgi:hypothetical protein
LTVTYLISHSATPTSLIFPQDPDLSQVHVLKDCNNPTYDHELVPIVTMSQSLPEVLDNLPEIQIPSSLEQHLSQQHAAQQNYLPGVYTLQEEPELEGQEENTNI